MELWWQSLSTAEHVLLYVAVPATLILLLQTLLLFLGGDAPDLDGDGVPDALEAGADADLDEDGIPDTPGESSTPLHILTLRGVVAFFCLFGWGSLGLSQAGLPLWLALFFGIQMGVIAMVAMALLLRWVLTLQSDGTLRLENAVGQAGEVYLTIPPLRSGTGKVNVLIQDQLQECQAVTDSPAPIPTGAVVAVLGLAGPDTLLVEPQA